MSGSRLRKDTLNQCVFQPFFGSRHPEGLKKLATPLPGKNDN